jgi:parvulin-like peptidyl-prolyl isomerase
MRTFKEIKSHYNFTAEDENRLVSLKNLMAENVDKAMGALQSWLLETKETSQFFKDETKRDRIFNLPRTPYIPVLKNGDVRGASKIYTKESPVLKHGVRGLHRAWFFDLFSGNYDSRYYDRLIRIGQKHVKAFVDAHYMNRAMNIVRNVCIEILNRSIEDAEERTKFLVSLEKILDINLDIITSSYIEEELRTYSVEYRVRSALLTFSERFSRAMNLVLVLALIGLTLGVVWLFINDIQGMIRGNLEHGIITALGSLLIIWVMMELMNTQILHLKGGKVRISVFIGVALVAFIRETLITTLKHEKAETIYYLHVPEEVVQKEEVIDMRRYLVIIGCLLLLVTFLPEKTWAENDDVIAKIGNKKITVSDLNRVISYYDSERQKAIEKHPQLKEQVLRQMVHCIVVSERAKKEGFDKRPDVKENLEFFLNNALAYEYLQKEVAGKVTVSEDEMKTYYETNQDKFMTPEAVRARHILIRADRTASEEDKKKAEDILKRIKAGEDFAKLASDLSDDPGSKPRGGDPGFFQRGRMVKPFEEAAFALKPGEVSGIVESPFGYHIIKVEERKESALEPYDQVKENIHQKLLQDKRKSKVDEFIEKAMEDAKVEIHPELYETT